MKNQWDDSFCSMVMVMVLSVRQFLGILFVKKLFDYNGTGINSEIINGNTSIRDNSLHHYGNGNGNITKRTLSIIILLLTEVPEKENCFPPIGNGSIRERTVSTTII